MVMIMHRGISSVPDSESHEELLDEAVENPSRCPDEGTNGKPKQGNKRHWIPQNEEKDICSDRHDDE